MGTRSLFGLFLSVALLTACSSDAAAPPTTVAPTLPRTTITLPGPTTAPAPTGEPTPTAATTSPPPTAPAGPWAVDTTQCPDPAAATAPITGTLTVAMAAPLTGGVPAAQWKPVIDGFRTAIDHANLVRALGDVHVELKVVDDRLDPDRTEDALQTAIDGGAKVVAGVIGTDSNLAARFTLNEQCIPQLLGFSPSAALGDVAEYPWTIGFPPPVADEVGVLASFVRGTLPDGGTLGVYAAPGALGDEYVAATSDLPGLTTVTTQRATTASGATSTAAIDALAAARPDVVLAAPEGIDCTLFLRGLAAARTSAPGWRPLVLLAAGCALPAAMQLVGPSADGVYSTAFTAGTDSNVDGMADYLTWMQGAGLSAEAASAAPGWSAGNSLVAILQQAQQSSSGLTQASIIDAARSIDEPLSLGRPDVVLRTDGAADPWPVQSMQVVRWDAAAQAFVAVGPVNSSFES